LESDNFSSEFDEITNKQIAINKAGVRLAEDCRPLRKITARRSALEINWACE
jgi:hypothetical protein